MSPFSLISRASLFFLLTLPLSGSWAQSDVHADLIPNKPVPKIDPLEDLLTPTIANPELFYREAWERTAMEVADLDSDRWFTVILADLDGPHGDFKAHEWLSTHAAEKLQAGLYVFPAADGSVKLGGGIFQNIASAIRMARSTQVKRLAGSPSPLIQQLGPLAKNFIKPPVAASSENDPVQEEELIEDQELAEDETESAEINETTLSEEPAPNAATVEETTEVETTDTDPSRTPETPTESDNDSPGLVTQLFSFIGLPAEGNSETAEQAEAEPIPAAQDDTDSTPAPELESAPVARPVEPTVEISPAPEPQQPETEPELPLANDGSDGNNDLLVRHETRAGSLDSLFDDEAPPEVTAPVKPSANAPKTTQPAATKPAPTSHKPYRNWPPTASYTALIDRYHATQEWLNSSASGTLISVQLDYLLSQRADRAINELLTREELQPVLDQLHVYRTRKYGKEALVLAFGSFPDKETAESAIAAAPLALHRASYQFRSLSAIRQDAIFD